MSKKTPSLFIKKGETQSVKNIRELGGQRKNERKNRECVLSITQERGPLAQGTAASNKKFISKGGNDRELI